MRRFLPIPIALFALAGCAKPGLHVSSEVVWADVDAESFPVTPGDIVRVEASGPVPVTSIIGAAEVTQILVPKDGVAMFRPAIGTTVVKVPGGHVVHDGGPRDPEVSWYDLEDEAIAWSTTPLGTPFPALTGAAPRFDPKEAADLDAALGEAKVSDGHAIRALFALRAIRTLEGLRIYPYAANSDEELPGEARKIKGRAFHQVKPGADVTVTTDGPAVLAISSRVVRASVDIEAEVTVNEAARVRGTMRSVVHHLAPDDEKQKIADDEDKPDEALSPLRKILVHVPPGTHTYTIAVSAPTWIAATSTDPYEQLVDVFGGSKHEKPIGEEALRECNNCAIALALTGGDLDASFDAALAAAGPLAKKEALALSAGAPFDRATQLESRAASRDREAVAQAGKDAASSIDASLREAWARGTLRGTSWQTVDENAPLTWFAAGGGSKEIGANLTEMTPEPWRRTQQIRLMATGPCAGEPVQLEVNGQTLTAQPSAARAMWHIVVPAGPAKVRRLDKGASSGTKVYALDEGGGSLIGAALPLSTPRTLTYPANATAPGVEIWLKAGASSEPVTIASADGAQKLDVVAHANSAGFGALAEDGAKWTRVATVPLPWNGAKVTGGANVAVRAVVRGVKREPAPTSAGPVERAGAPNIDAVIAASRKLLAAKTNADRAAAAIERGKLLASYGAERAALDDADLAQSYGAADATAQIQTAFKPPAPKALDLAEPAYGLESDFDPNAARCAVGEGPRAKIGALDKELRARPKSGSFDRSLAVQAATLKTAAPDDPRGDTLITLAGNGSRWKLLRDVDGGGARVPRPSTAERNPLLDPDGHLRPHLLGGDPFGKNYVGIASDHPARAVVPERAHLDILCTPRRAPGPSETCPIEVSFGDTKVPVTVNDEGKATVELPRAKGRGKAAAELSLAVGPSKADYSALIRIVLDKEAPNTTKVDGVGFVLDTPHIQYRFLLPPNKPIRVKASQLGLLRVDADAEGNDKPEVIANVGGKDIPIPLNGDPKVLPMTGPNAPITITSRGGTASVAIAERVEAESRTPEGGTEPAAALATKSVDATSARTSISDGTWRDTAEKSPAPPGWLLDHLGTFESDTGVNLTTLRDGSRADTQPDTYGFQEIAYRRRIESINLFSEVDGVVRLRSGQPTYGGSATLYEDWNAARLRITGTADVFDQSVNGSNEITLRPRGFIEYSARVTPSIYILPRIGYDGYFTTIKTGLNSLKDVDDDLFNPLRFARPNYAFLQALFWWVPLFDEINYLRVRGTFDVGNGAFSHADIRPGVLFVAGPIELNGYADAQYIKATTGARTSSGVDISGSILLLLHAPITAGSFEVRPYTQGVVRDDGGYEFNGGITLLASAHRGVRDYSSLELSFPEATAGGVPWRTEGREGP